LELLLNWYILRKCQKVVVIESIYSMDGTICDLPSIKKHCMIHNATLVVDEAHGLGTLGSNGRGLEEYYNMRKSADIIVGTFSKSLSNLGGYICASKNFIEKCEYYSHSNVFSAGLSAYHACGALSALQNVNRTHVLNLHENTRILRKALKDAGFQVEGHDDSPVIPVVFAYDVFKLVHIAHTMHQKGYAIAPVLPPACSVKTPRFRITATSWQTTEQILAFVNTLKNVEHDYVSKMNMDVLTLYKRMLFLKSLYYKLHHGILTIWTGMLRIKPCINTFFMKYVFALSQFHQIFVFYKIIKAYCTIGIQ
jgi:7-keto-8-aminopelargonate synthetase-like enzyme